METYILVQRVFVQVSSNYDSAEKIRTIAVQSDATIGEIMQWANKADVLAKGDLILTIPDNAS